MAKMVNLKINIGSSIFLSDKTGIIATNICLEDNGKYFPSCVWSDYTSELLRMWTDVILKHHRHDNVHMKLYFMDGPYRLDIFKDEDMQLSVKCINFRNGDICEHTIVCSYLDFLKAIYSASKAFSYTLYLNRQVGNIKSTYDDIVLQCRLLKTIIFDME